MNQPRKPDSPAAGRDIERTFLRWTSLHGSFHRGYVVVSSLYFVLTAHLSGSQLVLLGTILGVTLLLSDIPTGVWSDSFSRKWPLVIGHAFLAAGMIITGLVTSFPLIVMAHVLWGLGWGFSNGADIAWITDELDQPDRIDRVLTARARWELIGGTIGIVAFGVLGWATSLATAVVVAGMAMAFLGVFVAVQFREHNFQPSGGSSLAESATIFRRGVRLARRNNEILLMFCATLVINGAAVITWLFPKQLINLGFPNNPVLWYTAFGIVSSTFGIVVLRLVEDRIHGVGVARRSYVLACVAGGAGLVILAYAPEALIGCVGVLLMRGISLNVTRAVSVIWVNRRSTSDVRATLQSFLGQAESIGEILGGFALAAIAQAAGMSITIVISAVLVGVAGLIVVRARADRVPLLANEAGTSN